ncbi:MAG TPA: dienelactone hydrolase family protein [Aggregatilinea sp.]|uniref:dienelactone hydrolase family protein n=1 Tax=Aggregatilinea sp. TaxID=2806333 RepID=UPI002BBB7ED5|nr:dienelactone hydrolase family protein [Aggregatilinea sp.]HML22643.1 dienelactone hydrolase family protein [Aggregatilinea sp.]
MKKSWIVLALGCLLLVPGAAMAQGPEEMDVTSEDVEITSGGQAYDSYLAAPAEGGPYPGIVLVHSFRGLEEGYRTMTDRFAAQGFVVLAVGWQTFQQDPSDDTVSQLLRDSIAFLGERDDVDAERLGLTGFCAGGRYTMLFLPQIEDFGAGVAWYGFPYGGATQPASLIDQLDAPMLILHGTADSASPIADIYQYATELTDAGKAFEMKVYYGEPHGFMLENGQLRDDEVAQDALDEMVQFFRRKLG